MNAYVELMNLSNVEDAIIIHLMYSLSINPSTISLLNFESIDDKKNLTYFDEKLLSYIIIEPKYHLYGDLLYFKKFKAQSKIKNNKNERSFLTKAKVKENFITSLASTEIFKRFKRGFNGKLAWFK